MTNEEVVQEWIKQARYEGHNKNSSLYFKGDTIYSYGPHAPLAKLIGENICLCSDETWSRTTSRHQSIIQCEIGRTCRLIFNLESLDSQIMDNVEDYNSKLESMRETMRRARVNKPIWERVIEDQLREARLYVETFLPDIPPDTLIQ